VLLITIKQYELLLREIIRHTPASDPDFPALTSTIDRIKEVNTSINEGKRQIENQTKMLEIEKKIVDLPPNVHLIQPTRRLIRTGLFNVIVEIKKKQTRLEMLFILFNDALLWLNPEYEFKGFTTLSDSIFETPSTNQIEIFKDQSHNQSDAQFPLLLEHSNVDECASWYESLCAAKQTLKEKEHSRKQSVSQRH